MGQEPTDPFRSRQVAFREREIVRAARALRDEVGCRAFAMSALAARLGISKGTLYQHFQSREHLLRRVAREGWDVTAEDVGAAARGSSHGDRLLRASEVLVRRLLGLDGAEAFRPCCLAEVTCPYRTGERTTVFEATPGVPEPDGLDLGDVLLTLSALVFARRRAAGRSPTEADVRAVLRHALGER